MEKKLIHIGNSLGTIIPHSLLQELGLQPGDSIEIKRHGAILILAPRKKTKNEIASEVDAKFMKLAEEFITEHEDVLKELATR